MSPAVAVERLTMREHDLRRCAEVRAGPVTLVSPHARGLETSDGLFLWKSAGGGDLSGKTILRAPDGRAVLVVGFNCYVQPVGMDLLIWHADEPDRLGSLSRRLLTLLLLDMSAVKPLKVRRAVRQELAVVFDGAPRAISEISLALPPGIHAWEPPGPLRTIPELVMLGNSSFAVPERGCDSLVNICLYIASPSQRTVEVVPQEWFNRGSYDFGYQWPSRVARHPETGELVGEGVRLGRFVLNSSGTERIA
jgi:hypothetical protein